MVLLLATAHTQKLTFTHPETHSRLCSSQHCHTKNITIPISIFLCFHVFVYLCWQWKAFFLIADFYLLRMNLERIPLDGYEFTVLPLEQDRRGSYLCDHNGVAKSATKLTALFCIWNMWGVFFIKFFALHTRLHCCPAAQLKGVGGIFGLLKFSRYPLHHLHGKAGFPPGCAIIWSG